MKQANRIILIAIAAVAVPSAFVQGFHVSTTSHMDGTHPMPPPFHS
jgi:hypothetical protein